MVFLEKSRDVQASATPGRVGGASGRTAADWDRPGRRVEIDRTALLLLGRTGNGRYAFSRSPGRPGPDGSRIVYMHVLQARLVLGAVPGTGRPGDRRGRWGSGG